MLFRNLPPWGRPTVQPDERRQLTPIRARRYDPALRRFAVAGGVYEEDSHHSQRVKMAAGMLDAPGSMSGHYNPTLNPEIVTAEGAVMIQRRIAEQAPGETVEVTALDGGFAAGVTARQD